MLHVVVNSRFVVKRGPFEAPPLPNGLFLVGASVVASGRFLDRSVPQQLHWRDELFRRGMSSKGSLLQTIRANESGARAVLLRCNTLA